MSSDIFPFMVPGARVVVRYRLALGDHGPAGEAVSDALGYLMEIDGTSVLVQTRTGDVRINRSSITHAKEVPPPPARKQRATPQP